ncbi:hypothetical protein QYE76_036118 [Lolium multiflorum]|uniref:CCHC-type domain-containing protein n=1 Tax=Lolium multiflorum TaxID=4521 RepID=A0AAD8R1T1_LOLMU|nr:hypothetical protein QYE76_036118 [Lolium multiflorum]
MAAVDLGSAEWERSKISSQDINLLKKLGISKKPKALCFPSEESYPTPPMGYRSLFASVPNSLGTVKKLAEANERANALAQKLEQSEEARKKAESDAIQARAEADKAKNDAAGVEDLKKKLHDAETSLSEHVAAQSAREEAIIKRLIFDNYSVNPYSADTSPASSFSKRTLVNDNLIEGSSRQHLSQDLQELRQQLQSMKKQTLAMMEQSRQASEREKIALQQAKEAIAAQDAAVAEATKASSRENYMLQLMTDASLDMTGSFLDTAAEDQRVEARANVLLRLATQHGSNFWNMNKELPELFGMLKAAEIEIKKEHQVLMVNKTTSFKKQGKSKGEFKKGGKKAATPPMKPKNGPKPDAECYYCKEKGHWKRNCSKYLADLKSGLVKKKKEGISDIHVIDVHFTGSRSSTWVFDTGSVAHICNSKQELKNKRQLLKDEVTMRVGNGSKVNVIAVGTLPLHLPSRD